MEGGIDVLKIVLCDNITEDIWCLEMTYDQFRQDPIAYDIYFNLEILLKCYKIAYLIDVKISDRLLWSERKLQ